MFNLNYQKATKKKLCKNERCRSIKVNSKQDSLMPWTNNFRIKIIFRYKNWIIFYDKKHTNIVCFENKIKMRRMIFNTEFRSFHPFLSLIVEKIENKWLKKYNNATQKGLFIFLYLLFSLLIWNDIFNTEEKCNAISIFLPRSFWIQSFVFLNKILFLFACNVAMAKIVRIFFVNDQNSTLNRFGKYKMLECNSDNTFCLTFRISSFRRVIDSRYTLSVRKSSLRNSTVNRIII